MKQQRSWPAFLRFRNSGLAYVYCCAGSALVGSSVLAAGWTIWQGPLSIGALSERVLVSFLITGFLLQAVSVVLVIPVSWAARRLQIESLNFYLAAGALCGGALLAALFGRPARGEEEFAAMLILSGPFFGASWGFLWWQTYRRWRANERP